MKKSKVEDKRFYMTITAIVAIVAVVGLVIMFIGRGRVSTEVSEADMIGQAFQLSASLAQVGVSKDIVTAEEGVTYEETIGPLTEPTEAADLYPDTGVVFGVDEEVPDLGHCDEKYTTIDCECNEEATYELFCSEDVDIDGDGKKDEISDLDQGWIDNFNLPAKYLGGMFSYVAVSTSDSWSEEYCGDCPDDVNAHCAAKAKNRLKCSLSNDDLTKLNEEAIEAKTRCLNKGASVTFRPRDRIATSSGTCS